MMAERQLYRCDSCGEVFNDPDLKEVPTGNTHAISVRGYIIKNYREMEDVNVCPWCGSDELTEVYRCEWCYQVTDDLYAVCKDCERKIRELFVAEMVRRGMSDRERDGFLYAAIEVADRMRNVKERTNGENV